MQSTNIWSSKSNNQPIIFGHLIERNMRNIFFFEKSYTNCDGETIPRAFSKKSKLSISLDQHSKVSYSLFLWYNKLRTIETYWNKAADHAFTWYKAFLINKRSGTSLPVWFSAWFLKKNISLVMFYYLAKFHSLFAFALGDIEQYV